jgi:hypothetical protein
MIGLAPEPMRPAWTQATRSPSALFGARAGRLQGLQPIHPETGIVSKHLRETRIDHRAHTVDSQGRLSDVRGHDHATTGRGTYGTVLGLRGQASVEREEIPALPPGILGERRQRVLDHAHTGHKDQQVALRSLTGRHLIVQLGGRTREGLGPSATLRCLAMAYLHGKDTALGVKHGGVTKKA